MKWCWSLAASACFILSSVSVHGQAAAKLLTDGQNAADGGDWKTAAKDFNTIVTTYPSTPGIEDITIRAGFAFLHSNDYTNAINVLQKMTLDSVAPEFRGKALFFTGLAQFSQAHDITDPKKAAEQYRIAEETLGRLIDYIAKDTSGKNTDLLENAMYYQSLCAYGQDKYDATETDLNALLQKFPHSLQRPDYLLLLGSVYAVQANDALNAKKPADPDTAVRAAVQKAIQVFDLVINDPNAKVQGNEASMREGEILYLFAQIDPTYYEKALNVFRKVLRKDDMIVVQQGRIDDLRKQQQIDLQASGAAGATASNMRALILDREVARLNELKTGDDPIIQALIRMAECYVGLKEADEARTILRRLHGVKLSADQQKEVDFQLLYSYTLGGQAQKADAALTDFLAKHPGDPQADSISVQIADALMKRKPPDYAGALHQAQRSLADFPNGKHVDAAVTLESKALTELGRIDEASKVIDDFLAKNPNNPLAYAMKVTQGEGQMNDGKLADAQKTFDAIRNNPKAGAFQASADAYYIQVLNKMGQYANVVAEAKTFQTKYASDNALPSVEVIAATAMDKLNDPGAIPALQAIAKQFGAEHPDIGGYALYNVVTIYSKQNKPDQMLAAANDLRTQFPTAYPLISAANDLAMAALEKAKKFDQAVLLYQPLTSVSDKAVASGAQNKIGTIWYDGAKAMGNYQSLSVDVGRPEAEKRLQASEQAFVATLKNFYDQISAVGDAFEGLITDGQLRVRWGLLTEANLEDYLTKQCADIADPAMQTHLELAKAGLVFYVKNGHLHDAEALARFDKALGSGASLRLTTQEADHYGTLLIGAKRYPDAMKVFSNLLSDAQPTEVVKLAQGYYGVAAVYLAQGDYANAKLWLTRMLSLPGGAAWSKHINDAQLAMAEIEEQSTDPNDVQRAMTAYASTMISPPAGAENQAKAMLGYGRILEKQGHPVKLPTQQDIQFATHYYEQVDLFYGAALPQQSAQGLLLAGLANLKAGNAAGAKADFDKLRSAYGQSAPDWVAKIPAGN